MAVIKARFFESLPLYLRACLTLNLRHEQI